MNSTRLKRTSLFIGFLFIGTVFLIMGTGYAWLTVTLSGTKENVIKAGTLALNLDDQTSNGINLVNGVPMLEEVALTKSGYTFTLRNTGTINSEYTIYLDDLPILDSEERLENRHIRYNFQSDQGKNQTKLFSQLKASPNRVLETGVIKPGETYTYTLRLWIDYDADNTAMNKVFRGKVRVEAMQEIEYLPNTLILLPFSTDSEQYFWKYKANITKIILDKEKRVISNPVETWDLSTQKNNAIVGYLTGNETDGYIVNIQANGPIYANTSLASFFRDFKRLIAIEGMENLDTSNVTNFFSVFSGSSSLTTLDLSNFDTSKATRMDSMFKNCSSLMQLDLSNFNIVSVTNIDSIFSGCSSLTQLDLSNFNTSNVTKMEFMFSGCSSLTQLNLNNFDFSLVTSFANAFTMVPSTTMIYVKDATAQSWVIGNGINFSTSNVLIAV